MSAGHELDPESLGDHVDRLYRAAWSMCGSREEAEDLVQETFVRVLERPRLLRSGNDLGYLLKVLRNTVISRHRAASRRPPEAPLPEDYAALPDRRAATPERHLEATELYAAIAALPTDFRDAVIAVDVMGLSYREAARALRAREATITTRVHRGRKQLAAALR
ncbi:MAG: sigma-70 family RNA polymerase sigma factor [Solirubrobacterales bacterium]|nr:sigma-70 family RNA polymerase sigma factor [Solirubrobacterales bacterium]